MSGANGSCKAGKAYAIPLAGVPCERLGALGRGVGRGHGGAGWGGMEGGREAKEGMDGSLAVRVVRTMMLWGHWLVATLTRWPVEVFFFFPLHAAALTKA